MLVRDNGNVISEHIKKKKGGGGWDEEYVSVHYYKFVFIKSFLNQIDTCRRVCVSFLLHLSNYYIFVFLKTI